MESLTGVHAAEFTKSQTMMLSTEVGKTMDREDLLSLHYIEATCTSRWALGFFLAHCIPQSGKLGSAHTARLCETKMQAFLSIADGAPCDSLEVPADLLMHFRRSWVTLRQLEL